VRWSFTAATKHKRKEKETPLWDAGAFPFSFAAHSYTLFKEQVIPSADLKNYVDTNCYLCYNIIKDRDKLTGAVMTAKFVKEYISRNYRVVQYSQWQKAVKKTLHVNIVNIYKPKTNLRG